MAVRRLAPSTIRNYQILVGQFCDFLCSPFYGWVQECEARFGTHPVQVCTEWNATRHLQDYEGRPKRRGLDVTDFYRNPHAPEFRAYGMVLVRNGNASRGGAPKRRSVVTLHGWAADAVKDYVENVWPLVRSDSSNALWATGRGATLTAVHVSRKFAEYRDELGLDAVLSPHALRHSYVTHLTEDGVDPRTKASRQTAGSLHHVASDAGCALAQDESRRTPPYALTRAS